MSQPNKLSEAVTVDVLNALSDTQIEHSRKLEQLDQIDQKLYLLSDKVQRLLTTADELTFNMRWLTSTTTNGFNTMAAGQAQITALLSIAIGQSDGEAS